ncbi:MAG: ABC transporter permease subunit [Verrucomicrobiia bacterium]|jgi:ABC-type transport system involved in multi-copper enzyme maturation permease subunit
MDTPIPRLGFSIGRLWTIGRNTMTEVIRQKFFYILLVFGLVVIASSRFFAQFSSVEQIKFIKDFSLAAMTVFGALIAMVGTAELLPLELDNRTIYPILAKPVYRAEFLLGKFSGMAMLILLTILLMSLIFAGLLFYTEHQLLAASVPAASAPGAEVSPQEIASQIVHQTRDPALLKAIFLIGIKALIVCSISLLISTFATSVIFNVISSVIIYICGHLEAGAREASLGDQSLGVRAMMLVVAFFVPDLNAFNLADSVVLGQHVPLRLVLNTASYGLLYAAVALAVALVIFQEKEI